MTKVDPTPETYNEATNRVNVDPAAFLHEDEGQVEETVVTPEEGEQTPGEGEGAQPEGGEQEPEKKPVEPADQQPTGEEPKVETPAAPQDGSEETIFAGKFKGREALEGAFRQLGGDPTRYKTNESLEEAYLVRQAEWTRARQEISEARKLTETDPAKDAPETKFTQLIEGAAQAVDWTKIKNAEDLMKATLYQFAGIFKDLNSTDKNALMDEIEARSIAKRERVAELEAVEKDVPRLKDDPTFRGAFATYVAGLKSTGQYSNLKDAMSTFLGTAPAPSAPVAPKEDTAEALKNSGAQPAQTTQDPSKANQPKTDEVDDIMNAFKNRKTNLFA